ncbi:MAG TPA: hypothetical protein VMP03_06235 [Methylomirabilota bacterium]|nr:hypothetical protein [Methylomirabilota bacterium]
MKTISRLSLAVVALAFTAGSAAAQCSYSMKMAKATPAPTTAQASTVDVATLVPPVLPAPKQGETTAPETTAE